MPLNQSNDSEKPCLVETSKGFSVSYKNKLLYSKYDPKKSILQIINSLHLLEGTLILCLSPALWYGLEELLKSLPAKCFILGIEQDPLLYEFSSKRLQELTKGQNIPVKMISPEELNEFSEIFSGLKKSDLKIPAIHNFKRAIPIEMSGGVLFSKDFYNNFSLTTENIIASFWKNRITLVKMGRVYSRNLFHNLAKLPNSMLFQDFTKKVECPIIVIGAGQSAESTINFLKAGNSHKYYILAVDAALPALRKNGIEPDGVVALECQLAIEKAYIGGISENTVLFADITSRPHVTEIAKNVCFFATRFSNATFFDSLSKETFFPMTLPPLGSVGPAAVLIALYLKKSSNVPVFVTGLDFSFSLGATHMRGVPAHLQRLCSTTRLKPVANYDAAFKPGAVAITGKNGDKIITDTALHSYAENFTSAFKAIPSLFDIGETGLPLGIQTACLQNISGDFLTTKDFIQTENQKNKKYSTKILSFLEEEERALNRLKELLMFGKDVQSCSCTIEEELEQILKNREYLYLHFPDGYDCDIGNISFLKRIRTEIDFFIKDIKKGIAKLS